MTIALQVRVADWKEVSGIKQIAFMPEEQLPGIETALINAYQLEQLQDVLKQIPHKLNRDVMGDAYESVNGANW
ncbi:TPA: hypothetical protein QDA74_003727 [Burkholderia territorii]|uniref:hypothetical protein n=1 Tax=Burkholderia territorii TaxID=1503055 RepID=UPI0011C99145|nr:hypothetical protein [Burkholderia territorii]TXG07053.1 hypothetical protein FU139_25415 [Burkholderia territorii]HDR8859229.1 hypothetical protein [Burkholderia territorii]HDR8866214.1 hypothetical protein [Burkholderia territorii]HDR8872318.1 hypothetical protein [Burkholderia territorii]HDR8878216.1 hypothetical protein [Burkholderia territorii]